jgi:hypothetical protein
VRALCALCVCAVRVPSHTASQGGAHRQPIAPPPYGAASQLRVTAVSVTRGLEEAGYIDYEVVTTHQDAAAAAAAATQPPQRASASSGEGDDVVARKFYTYCRYSLLFVLVSGGRPPPAGGGGGRGGGGGGGGCLLPDLPRKTLNLHGGLQDEVGASASASAVPCMRSMLACLSSAPPPPATPLPQTDDGDDDEISSHRVVSWVACGCTQLFVEQRRLALDRWLRVLLLKPQTRSHTALLQFMGLLAGWDAAELSGYVVGGNAAIGNVV